MDNFLCPNSVYLCSVPNVRTSSSTIISFAKAKTKLITTASTATSLSSAVTPSTSNITTTSTSSSTSSPTTTTTLRLTVTSLSKIAIFPTKSTNTHTTTFSPTTSTTASTPTISTSIRRSLTTSTTIYATKTYSTIFNSTSNLAKSNTDSFTYTRTVGTTKTSSSTPLIIVSDLTTTSRRTTMTTKTTVISTMTTKTTASTFTITTMKSTTTIITTSTNVTVSTTTTPFITSNTTTTSIITIKSAKSTTTSNFPVESSNSGIETDSDSKSVGNDDNIIVASSYRAKDTEKRTHTHSGTANEPVSSTKISQVTEMIMKLRTRTKPNCNSKPTAKTSTGPKTIGESSTATSVPTTTARYRKVSEVLTETEVIVVTTLQTMGCVYMLWILGATFVLFLLLRDFSHERCIHMSHEVALFCGHALIVTMRHETQLQTLCKMASFGLQYFFIVTFTFMALESIQVYSVMTNAINHGGYLTRLQSFVIGWGVPLIVLIITGSSHHDQYISTFSCWLNMGHHVSMGTLVPVGILCALAIIGAEASSMDHQDTLSCTNMNQFKAAIANQIGLFFTVPANAASWGLGAWAVYKVDVALYGLVFASNITLGTCIFMFHALGNPKITCFIFVR